MKASTVVTMAVIAVVAVGTMAWATGANETHGYDYAMGIQSGTSGTGSPSGSLFYWYEPNGIWQNCLRWIDRVIPGNSNCCW